MIQVLPLPPIALRRRVAQHLPWAATAEWRALFGGRTNSAWQVSDGQAPSAILKLYRSAANNPVFPNDADAEAQLLQHLEQEDIAPKLIARFDCEMGQCTLYTAIPGTPWKEGVLSVAKLMRHLHALAPPENLRRLPDGSDAILQNAESILNRCERADHIRAFRPELKVAPGQHCALLHCDIVPGNLISNGGSLHLIDWQCPGQGDPCEDISSFLSPAMQTLYRGQPLSDIERDSFLEAYGGRFAQRYRALAPAYSYRTAAYCQWQSERGRPDYREGLNAELDALRCVNVAR